MKQVKKTSFYFLYVNIFNLKPTDKYKKRRMKKFF